MTTLPGPRGTQALLAAKRLVDAPVDAVESLAAEHGRTFGVHIGPATIAIVGDRRDLVDAVVRGYRPNAVLTWGERYDSPLWDQREDGLAYVCRDFACKAPVSTTEDLLAQLEPGGAA